MRGEGGGGRGGAAVEGEGPGDKGDDDLDLKKGRTLIFFPSLFFWPPFFFFSSSLHSSLLLDLIVYNLFFWLFAFILTRGIARDARSLAVLLFL